MKKYLITMFAAMFAALAVLAGSLFNVGETGELTDGAIIKGVVLASTNASQTATVKAVYTWPVWGEATDETVSTVKYLQLVTRVDTLTNWCDWVTETYTVKGGVTNYYAGITVATNEVLQTVEKPVTNTVTRAVIVGRRAVTNSLYSLTASGGIATNGTRQLVGAGAKLLIENAPVTIFWE